MHAYSIIINGYAIIKVKAIVAHLVFLELQELAHANLLHEKILPLLQCALGLLLFLLGHGYLPIVSLELSESLLNLILEFFDLAEPCLILANDFLDPLELLCEDLYAGVRVRERLEFAPAVHTVHGIHQAFLQFIFGLLDSLPFCDVSAWQDFVGLGLIVFAFKSFLMSVSIMMSS